MMRSSACQGCLLPSGRPGRQGCDATPDSASEVAWKFAGGSNRADAGCEVGLRRL